MAQARRRDHRRHVDEGDEAGDLDLDRTLPPGSDAVRAVEEEEEADGPEGFSTTRLFGSPSFFRLWLASVASSLGDWVAFVAIVALAARVSGNSEAAVGLVLSARLVPGFFLAPVLGVLVDRWDRRRVMVGCDVGRGLVMASLPFIDTIFGLFLASLLLEILTLMWAPAKEASVPNMVPKDYLATANSLNLVAAYGTFPVGSLVFTLLAGVAKWLGTYDALASLEVDQEFVAIYFDVATFFVSAILIATLAIPRRGSASSPAGGFRQALHDVREGIAFIRHSAIVRAVLVAIATGLIGGGMLVPLGAPFATRVLGGGSAAFGLLLTALGVGMAAGIVTLTVVQRRLPHERVFVGSVFGAGTSILLGASMSDLRPALVFVAVLGVCAGAVYVLGFTILQANVDDELRGRIFATLFTIVRLCLLIAFAIAPLLSSLLDSLSNRLLGGSVVLLGIRVGLPGTRLTLWLGGLIITAAGFLAVGALRRPKRPRPARPTQV